MNPELSNTGGLASCLAQDIPFSPSEAGITRGLPHPSLYMESGGLNSCSLA